MRGQKWIVVGVVRGNSNAYSVDFIPHRTRVNLLNVIRAHFLPGVVIMTDKWMVYLGL